jgi:hypothetical protein
MANLAQRNEQFSEQATGLLLVVSPDGGKTEAFQAVAAQTGLTRLNLGLELSRELLEIAAVNRIARLRPILEKLVVSARRVRAVLSDEKTPQQDTLLLDNLEILFDRNLGHDPLQLLKNIARLRLLVAAWPGTLVGEHLVYAPGHHEQRSYPLRELKSAKNCWLIYSTTNLPETKESLP